MEKEIRESFKMIPEDFVPLEVPFPALNVQSKISKYGYSKIRLFKNTALFSQLFFKGFDGGFQDFDPGVPLIV